MKRKKKSMEVFGLSFLDCICCGFGGVILLYVMTTMEDGETREGVVSTARAEVQRIDERLEDGQKMLAEIRNSLEDEKVKLAEIESEIQQLDSRMKQDQAELSDKKNVSEAKLEHASKLQSDIDAVKKEISDLKNRQTENAGGNLTESKGTERRHYVTGLRLDGTRAVVLFDRSTSTVANSLAAYQHFYANATEEYLMTAPKRIRMLDSLDWLIATSQSEQLQIILYGEEARFATPETKGDWISRKDADLVQASLDHAWAALPKGSSNLIAAIQLANTLKPPPDSLYIITDSLPTNYRRGIQNDHNSRRSAVNEVINTVRQAGQSMHVILFPMVGNDRAVQAYWDGAKRTNGSFFTPAPDWPN